MSVEKTLEDRDKVHGNYSEMAIAAQNLKRCVYHGRKYGEAHLSAEAAEAIDMICTKLARILAGDPHHADHWHDIAGYATLVERHLKGEEPHDEHGELVAAALDRSGRP